MRRFIRENSLTLFFGMLFLAAIFGQALAGHSAFNAEQIEHGEQATSLPDVVGVRPGGHPMRRPDSRVSRRSLRGTRR
jgi:hypothetical protein